MIQSEDRSFEKPVLGGNEVEVMVQERRRSTRIPFRCPVTLTDEKGAVHRGTVIDISMHGLQVKLDEQGEPFSGDSIMRVDLAHGQPSFRVDAKVHVIRQISGGSVGVAFDDSDRETLATLQNLIRFNLGDTLSSLETGDDSDDEIAGDLLDWYSRPR